MAHCINKNSKELNQLSQSLGIKPTVLMAAVQEWQNDNNTDLFPSESYLKRVFKLSGESATQFASFEDFKNAALLWDKKYSKPKEFSNENEALEYYNKAVQLFGKDNVSIIPQNDNTNKVVVLKPVKNIFNHSFDNNLNVKLKEIMTKLFPEIKLEYTSKEIEYKEGTAQQRSSSLQSAQNTAKSIYFDFLNSNNLSLENVERINQKLKQLSDRLGDVPWRLVKSQRTGNYYVAGYKNRLVTSDDYYSPHLNSHYYQKSSGGKIIGQADLQALHVLINYIEQNQDTLPHEYAHHYISWYKDSRIVKDGIRRFGSEEALVQAIGENTVKRGGEINTWWKRFTNYVKAQFNKITGNDREQILQILTDAFLQNKKLGKKTIKEGLHNQTVSELRDEFYNTRDLTASQREYLARQAIVHFSNILDELQGNKNDVNPITAKQKYFKSKFDDKDFTSMTRNEIIQFLSPKGIFDVVRKEFFHPLRKSGLENKEIIRQLEVAYAMFYELINSAHHKLIDQEHITMKDTVSWVDTIDSETVDQVLDGLKDGEQEAEHWMKSFQTVSVRDSLSPLIKRAFDKIRIRDDNGNIIKDEYGFDKLLPANTVYNTILATVSKSTDIFSMEKNLADIAEDSPWVKDVLELIKEEPFRSQFFQNFRKDGLTYSVVTRELDDRGNYQYKTILINTNDIQNTIKDKVKEAVKNKEVSILTNIDPITGVGEINTKEVKAITSQLESLIKELQTGIFNKSLVDKFAKLHTQDINMLLSKLGIDITNTTLSGILSASKNKSKYTSLSNSTAYQLLTTLHMMMGVLDKSTSTKYDLFGKDGVSSLYSKVAEIIGSTMEQGIEPSVFENKKLYYSYVTPSYLGKLIINLKNTQKDFTTFKKYIDEQFGQYEYFVDANGEFLTSWLQDLSQMTSAGEEARNLLQHKVQLHFNNVAYTDLSALDYTLSLIQEFFSDTSKNPKQAWYHVPILADKPSAEFIQFKRYTNKTQVKKYDEVITDKLVNTAIQELKRIKTVLERANNGNVETITSFDASLNKALKDKRDSGKPITIEDLLSLEDKKAGGSRFKFLDFLNPLLENETIVDYINTGNKSEEVNLILKEAIKKGMGIKFQNAFDKWKEIGILSQNKDTKEFTHLNNLGNTTEEVKEQLRNYFYNSYLATTNIIQMTVTDIAFYKNAEDFQKRYAQIHSPAMRLNVYALDSNNQRYSQDGIEKTMYIKDEVTVSNIKEQVIAVFDDKIANAQNESQRKGFEKLKQDAIKGFDEINVADAQALTSLTGYRKKLGMAGKWTPQMEEVYKKIKAGEPFNLESVNIIWQPLKPFVYTQIAKNSFVKTISKLKVPIQNKNSEYLLLMTAVLMEGNQKNNKLKAIHDFMEESGIDTIQFQSAVKSGEQGVIDINDLNSYNEIKARLNEHLYEDTSNNDKVYNEQYVHQIPFEDYGIQQEVPEHSVDATQLFGTQIRKLILADLTPGNIFKVANNEMTSQELIDHYQDLVAANVNASYESLIEDLGLNEKDPQVRTKIMSELLQEEIRKNGRYGSDLLRAVTLDNNGEFTIPLSDPMHSNRIQQLLNSIIKSRITKQKIKGGAVVQVSSYGFNVKPQIVFNEDGSIKHFECYIACPSESWKELLKDTDKHGNTVYNINKKDKYGKPILSEDMRKLIGYRIPTEDKYSMAPLYIKGFLPSESGSAIVLPEEITLLSGSDKPRHCLTHYNKKHCVNC